MASFRSLSIVFIFTVSFVISHGAINNKIVITDIDRNINLESQLARHKLDIQFKNTGSDDVSQFHLTFEDSMGQKLSFIDAQDGSGGKLKITKGEKGSAQSGSYTVYAVNLASKVQSQGTGRIKVEAVFAHTMTPFPTEASQNEKQKVKYADNQYIFSPYTITVQKTVLKLASTTIISHSDPTAKVSTDTLTYGPYHDQAPFSHTDLHVHFENVKPFLTAEGVTKEIEVSHWGNVAEEITVDVLKNDGAKLKGTFSRFDYRRGSAFSGVNAMTLYLPTGAADAYYRDEIGNISTSHLSNSRRGEKLELQPRFPLFGGWKIGFYFGYNLPISDYLSVSNEDSSLYVLKPYFFVSWDNIIVDGYTLRVILPEGATDIEVHTPFDVSRGEDEKVFTYLDVSGRPVVVLKKSQVINDHNQQFHVTYRYRQLGLLREPFLLMAAYFSFFLLVMLYTRLEFHIGSNAQKEKTQ